MEPGAAVENFTWFHVSALGELLVAVLSERPVVYKGHYVAGAVQPCSVPICGKCRAGIGHQTRCVLSVLDIATGLRGMIELGEQTGRQLRTLMGPAGQLRGLMVRLSKEGGAARGRILVDAYHGPLVVDDLPEPQDPLVCLNAQWARLALRQRAKDGPAAGQVSIKEETPVTTQYSSYSHLQGPARVKAALADAEKRSLATSSGKRS